MRNQVSSLFRRVYSTTPPSPPDNPLTSIFATASMLSFFSYHINQRMDRIETQLKSLHK
jgi:hypothetical protein